MARKLYCYVDESGQDTKGKLFVVAVVITAEERERIIDLLEAIELVTGKHRMKWIRTSHARRLAYVRRVLSLSILRNKLSVALFHT